MSMLTAIETDLHNAGVEVSADLHKVLAHHTKLSNVVSHLAADLQEFTASADGQTLEALAGLNPGQRAVVNGVVAHVAEWVEGEAQTAA